MSDKTLPFPLAQVPGVKTAAGYTSVPCRDCIPLNSEGEPNGTDGQPFVWWKFLAWGIPSALLWQYTSRDPFTMTGYAAFGALVWAVILLVPSIFAWYHLATFTFGSSLFVFKNPDGWHVHRRNPVKGLIVNMWGYRPDNTVIGNVIRIRNGGVVYKVLYQLFTFRPYNAVFKPHLRRRANRMFLNFNATLWTASVREGNFHFGSCPPTEFNSITSVESQFMDRPKHLERDNELLLSTLRVIRRKLDESPQANKASAPRRWIYKLVDQVNHKLQYRTFPAEPTPPMQALIDEIDQLEAVSAPKQAAS